jgi:DNA polymerase I-like protein with 3'-5' exonuclease and polymerase domains
MKLLSLDIETCCNVQECKGYGTVCKEDHALNPWQSRITVIGVTDGADINFVSRTTHGVQVLLDSIGDYELVGHNLKFDLLHLASKGLEIPLEKWAHDTQLMAYVLTEKIPDSWLEDYEQRRKLQNSYHRKAGKHSLKTLAPYFLGVAPFWETEDKDNDDYVLTDARHTLALFRDLSQRLKDRGEYDFYINKQLPWAKMLLRAEKRGIKIDLGALTVMEMDLKKKEAELLKQLDETWAEAHEAYLTLRVNECFQKYMQMAVKAEAPFLPGSRYYKLYEAAGNKLPTRIDYESPKQMLWLLRDYLGYDVQSLSGDEGTGREILERLKEEGKKDVEIFLEWRKVKKLLTSFIPNYKDLHVDGALHPIFNPDTTRTGRTSSQRPNLQQVPPELRRLFTPRPGFKFIGFDQAAIEAKLIALYSQDPTLFSIIKEGISIHDHNVKVFFGFDTRYELVKTLHAAERAATKNVGFALFYNAGANRVRIAFAQKGFHFNDSQCREILARFRESYKEAAAFSKEIVKYLEQGNVLPNLLGRPIRIENPEDAYMTAFNTLIQSAASDLLLDGALRAENAMLEAGIEARPVAFVHDFVMFEVPEKRADEASEIIKHKLTDYQLSTRHGRIELSVEGGVMDKWEK